MEKLPFCTQMMERLAQARRAHWTVSVFSSPDNFQRHPASV